MRLNKDFFKENAIELAPKLLGKKIIRKFDSELTLEFIITEVEAYCGEEDLACHASKGRTPRTEVMYYEGGYVYVYLIYGMYWMLNFVCGDKDNPQAILIRGVENINGPGRIGKTLKLDKSFYGEDLTSSDRIWLEDNIPISSKIKCSTRIGVNYAGIWATMPYRFYLE